MKLNKTILRNMIKEELSLHRDEDQMLNEHFATQLNELGTPQVGAKLGGALKSLGGAGGSLASRFGTQPIQKLMAMLTKTLSSASVTKRRSFLVTLLKNLNVSPAELTGVASAAKQDARSGAAAAPTAGTPTATPQGTP